MNKGQFFYVHSCPDSTYEDIQALMETERDISVETFRKAIGPSQWASIQSQLGYDRSFSIRKDWHVRFYKGVYRGIPCVFVRHSRIEHIFTLGGACGVSLAGTSRGQRRRTR